MSWPAVHAMFAHWVPPYERSKFVTAYHGSAIGIAFSYPLFGYLISITSWSMTYYLAAIVGFVWFVAWQYFAYDTPQLHPRISLSELEFIEQSLAVVDASQFPSLLHEKASEDLSTQEKIKNKPLQPSIPWRSILTSLPLWIIAVGQWGSEWCTSILLAQSPTYFQQIHHWDVEIVGLLTGLPHLLKLYAGHKFSKIGERMIVRRWLSTTCVRRCAGAISGCGQGAFVMAMAFVGPARAVPIVLFVLANVAQSATASGPLANLMDLSPNFAAVTVGMVQIFTASTSVLSPLMVSQFTLNNVRISYIFQMFFF